jgi:polyisoprenoid-binding protein YceI
MIQKKLFTAAATIFLGTSVAVAGPDGPEDNPNASSGPAYSFNKSESTLYWEGSKPGGKHLGTIEVINGTATTDGDRIVGGTFEIDMSSIRNDDVKNEGSRTRLLNHLESEDFFFVEKYPTSTFKIAGVEPAAVNDPNVQMITGHLTIRGNTNEVSFPAEISMTDRVIHAKTGEIRLDRTAWEVNHKSKSIFAGLKDSFIDDEMIVKLDVYLDRN